MQRSVLGLNGILMTEGGIAAIARFPVFVVAVAGGLHLSQTSLTAQIGTCDPFANSPSEFAVVSRLLQRLRNDGLVWCNAVCH